MTPEYRLAESTFGTWERAFGYAFHIARVTRRKCRVAKHVDRWQIWMQNPTERTS